MLTMMTSPNAADLAAHAAPKAPIPAATPAVNTATSTTKRAAAHIPGAATATAPATIAGEGVAVAPLPDQPAITDDIPTKITQAAA